MANGYILTSPVHPDAATTFVRELPIPEKQILNRFLPDKTITTDRVEVTEAVLNGRKAKYRAFDGNIPQIERDGFESRMVAMLPMSIQGGKGELERLALEKIRQSGGSDNAIIEAIYNDFEIAVRYIRNAVEAKRGELLTTGKLVVAENGVNSTADFGVPTNHFPTAAVLWSDVENASPIIDLLAWAETYSTDAGEAPAGIVISNRTLGYLLRSREIRVFANLAAAGGPAIVGRNVVDAVLSNFGLPPIVAVYDEKIEGTRVIPEGKVIFVPSDPNKLGNTYWGPTMTAVELINAQQTDLSYADAPGLVGVVIKTGPPFQESTMVDSLNLPVLNDPKSLFTATVAAA